MFAEVSSLLVIYFSGAFSQPRRETSTALLLRCIVGWPHHLTAFFLPEACLQVPVRTEGSSGPFCKSCTTSPSCQYLQPVLGGSPELWIRRRVPLAKVRRKPQGRQYMGEVVLEPCGSIHFVDRFHWKNHKGTHKNFTENCNPADNKRIDGANTEICEQSVRWFARHRCSANHMTPVRFTFYFLVLADRRNEILLAKHK